MAVPTRDHIRPRSKGGTLAQGKALACERCNGDKRSRTLGSWLYRLRRAGDRRAEIVARRISAKPAVP
jgi:5-methylcytosine-specific restriction endonuclease McrA